MSSTNASEKPCSSSGVRKVKAKGAAYPTSSSQSLEAMDKRLDLLLARVGTLENSLNELTTSFCNKDTEEDADLKDEEVSDDDTLVDVAKITSEIEDLALDSS
ncbi:uncharacterized protein LOC117579939 [Drosophila guanche]|uniref:uncharacterized protein LOC117579939 n=1 Tax=Drosophila guanche TaxID=7266 RepID=UPI00147088E7|nr:uncharacterized protein LOC117579939 [Drosophila guanche]